MATIAVIAGAIGLVSHQRHRATAAPPASNIGTVSTAPAQPTPSPDPSASAGGDGPGLLSTHSTELGAQGSNSLAPSRVSIPALRVNGVTTASGLASDNRSLDLPPSATSIVWWAYGATPGSTTGTVLLAGHVSWNGRAGTLGRIGRLRLGDHITVTRHDGARLTYAVTGRRRVPKMSLDELGLFAPGGSPRLILVTCGGTFNTARHSYEDNVVVQARPLG